MRIARLMFIALAMAYPIVLFSQNQCQPPSPNFGSRPNIFTEEQETFLGDAIAEQIQSDMRLVDDESIVGNLARIGNRVAKHLPPNKLNFRFYVVESADANAFVLPGGRIYVTRKLLSFVQTEDELAGVLAHEMGHMIARQASSDMTRIFREVLGVTSVGDREDVKKKYNQMVDNQRRNPKVFKGIENNEDKDQVVADQIGLYALAGAGYDPQSFSKFFDRLVDSKSRPGGFFAQLFGVQNPDVKRLKEMIKVFGILPAACVEGRVASADDDFKKWQQVVVNYSGGAKKELVHSVVSKTQLSPALRGEVTHLRFSPDGHYVLAQDDSGITVLTRDPFKVLFNFPAPEAKFAQFTPDSKGIVFYNSDLRVETWSVEERKSKEAHELFVRNKCLQSTLSPDGKALACLDGELSLCLYDVASGNLIFEKKKFYQPDSLDIFIKVFNAALNSEDDDYEVDWVNMAFSPDGRYLAAGKRSTSVVAFSDSLSLATDSSALGYDLVSKTPLQLRGDLKKLVAGGFAFMGPDRIVGRNPENPKKSGILSFPGGESLDSFEMFPGKLTGAFKGNYVMVRPLGNAAVAVMDIAARSATKGNKNSAFDIYGDVFVSERMNGELGLYKTEKNELKSVVELPANDLGRLRATAVSEDLKTLAVSEKTRGAVWDLAKGDRVFYVRGFRGAHAAGTNVYADFPKLEKQPRQIGVMDTNSPNTGRVLQLGEDRQRLFGKYMLVTRELKKGGGYYDNVALELQNLGDFSMLWKKEFQKEAPRVWLEPDEDSLVFSWPAVSKTAQNEIKNDAALRSRASGRKEQEGDYYLQVLDPKSGTMRGRLMIDTGKGSFKLRNFFAVNDSLIASDSQNRVQIYSIASGEKKGQVFGSNAAANNKSGLLAVQNESGQVVIYDLASLQKKDEFNFGSPVVLARFSPDGKKLMALTAGQTVYVVDLSSLAGSK